ncbi:MAG: ATP-dependent Clp protease proteolytic subunit, partial [Anaerolineales bacterium]|nr:ATP-dependent Clp protease proteolytic subunit [Anaerolineales bacterium]
MESNGKAGKTNKAKQPPILFDKTQKIIKDLTAKLGGTLVTYFNNPRGAVCHDDVLALFELLEKIGRQKTIYLFIKSSGGNGQASLRIVNLLRQYCDEIVAVIPLECASAATMITLGANEIHMGPMAYLTSVDTSLTHSLSPIDRDNDRVSVSLDELNRVVRLWQAQKADSNENPYQQLFQHVHPLVIGAVDRAESLSIMLCKELLAYHIKDEAVAERIASTLNSKYPSHGYPILFEEAKRIGLRVNHLPPEINSQLL